MRRVTAALLALLAMLPLAALAQWWEVDMERGQDPLGLILLIAAGLAYVFTRDSWRKNKVRGLVTGTAWVAIIVGAFFFQPLMQALALLALIFIIYITWRQLRG